MFILCSCRVHIVFMSCSCRVHIVFISCSLSAQLISLVSSFTCFRHFLLSCHASILHILYNTCSCSNNGFWILVDAGFFRVWYPLYIICELHTCRDQMYNTQINHGDFSLIPKSECKEERLFLLQSHSIEVSCTRKP